LAKTSAAKKKAWRITILADLGMQAFITVNVEMRNDARILILALFYELVLDDGLNVNLI